MEAGVFLIAVRSDDPRMPWANPALKELNVPLGSDVCGSDLVPGSLRLGPFRGYTPIHSYSSISYWRSTPQGVSQMECEGKQTKV